MFGSMNFPCLRLSVSPLASLGSGLTWRTLRRSCLLLVVTLLCLVGMGMPSALAGLNDDRYDGDIFALYAGNGSLVPPRFTLKDALKRDRPVLLTLYIDDSSDCKLYSSIISQIQGFYGRAADLLAVRADSIPVKATYEPTEPGYYYKGVVPQTVIFDVSGKVVLNQSGNLAFEQLDDKFREVFNLLPRSESIPLRRRLVNEINTELVKQ